MGVITLYFCFVAARHSLVNVVNSACVSVSPPVLTCFDSERHIVLWLILTCFHTVCFALKRDLLNHVRRTNVTE